MAPVPPWAGNRNVAFGPQLTSSLRSTRLFEDALEIHGGHPLPHPADIELRRVVGPHLAVVRKHERVAEAGAESRQQPVAKRRRRAGARGLLQVEEAVQARDQLVVRQPPDVVLKRIRNPAIAHPHPRFAHVLDPRVAKRRVHHRVEVRVVREQHVAAEVPGEPIRVDNGGGQAAGMTGGFVQRPVRVPELVQPPGRAKPGRPRADDDNARVSGHPPSPDGFGATGDGGARASVTSRARRISAASSGGSTLHQYRALCG